MCCHFRWQPGTPAGLTELWPLLLPQPSLLPANSIKHLPNRGGPMEGVSAWWQHKGFQHLCQSWRSPFAAPQTSQAGVMNSGTAQRAELGQRQEELGLNLLLPSLDGCWNPPRQKQNHFHPGTEKWLGLCCKRPISEKKKKSFFSNLYQFFFTWKPNTTQEFSICIQQIFNRLIF